MRKIISLTITTVLLLSLLGCANSSNSDSVRAKCPACGYEFDFDARG